MMTTDLTPSPLPRSRRSATALTVAAAGLLLAGIGVASVALVDADASTGQPAIALDVDDATSNTTPSTVPPVVAIPDTPPPAPRPAPSPATPRPDSGPVQELSPLAAQLGERFSVIPEPIEARPRPTGLEISSIDTTRFPVREVGLEDDGQLEVPDETEIGWYKYGATAGRPGATVLAAHVSWNNTTGPFFELGTVEPGDEITVALDDGSTRQYEVIERTMYDKSELPRDRIWRNTGAETLVLITCGGDFNPDIRRYRQNIVVYAVPVG